MNRPVAITSAAIVATMGQIAGKLILAGLGIGTGMIAGLVIGICTGIVEFNC